MSIDIPSPTQYAYTYEPQTATQTTRLCHLAPRRHRHHSLCRFIRQGLQVLINPSTLCANETFWHNQSTFIGGSSAAVGIYTLVVMGTVAKLIPELEERVINQRDALIIAGLTITVGVASCEASRVIYPILYPCQQATQATR